MRGMIMSHLPWEILASIVLVITHLVPFVTFGGSKDRNIIFGAATFNKSNCEGNPETSKEFKTSGLPGIHEVLNPRIGTQLGMGN